MSYVPGLICSSCDSLVVEMERIKRQRDEAREALRRMEWERDVWREKAREGYRIAADAERRAKP